MFVDLTQTRVTSEKEISTEELLPSEWPKGMFVEASFPLMSVVRGSSPLWASGPGLNTKASGEGHEEQAREQLSCMLPASLCSCLGSCPDWSQCLTKPVPFSIAFGRSFHNRKQTKTQPKGKSIVSLRRAKRLSISNHGKAKAEVRP